MTSAPSPSATKTAGRRSAWSLAAFSAPCLPLAALGLPLIVTLPEYYANDLGLPLAVVGTVFAAVRLGDVFLDPILGSLMDSTRSPLGRFRPWLALAAPLLMLAGWRLFFATPGVGALHLWLWLTVAYAAFSIGVVAQTSWGAVLSPDYAERSRIYGWWQAANVIGILAALLLAVAQTLSGAPYALGVQAMGVLIIVLAPLTIALAIWRLDEPVVAKTQHRVGLKSYLTLLRRNAVQRLMLVDLFSSLAPGIVGALFFFYFQREKGFDRTEAGILLVVYFLAAFVSAPVWTWLSHRFGKHRALVLNGLAYAVVQGALFLTPARNLPVAVVFVALCGLPYSAPALLLRAMMADVGDEVRLQTGHDRTGQFYAMLSSTSKIGSALSVWFTFKMLDMSGFDPRGGSTDLDGLDMLRFLYIALPGLLGVLSAIIMVGYPLTEARHRDIRRALERDT